MADIHPFRGVRFDSARAGLSRVLCPPYDVITPPEAARLRNDPYNAIHLELPPGKGAGSYRGSARKWEFWRRDGVLRRDPKPALYVCEERFQREGRRYRRLGFLSAMGVDAAAARWVVRHEKTLDKPKADRMRVIETMRINTSPIFGMFGDPSGHARRVLTKVSRGRPVARGNASGIAYRLWRVEEEGLIGSLRDALSRRTILIADGHHRYEVSRNYYARTRAAGASRVLIYLCPEEDAGLLVLPTHRLVSRPGLKEKAAALCRMTAVSSRPELLRRLARSRNPYAFGLYQGGLSANAGFLAEPYETNGCRSGLCVEWLRENLLDDVSPECLRYTHDPKTAWESSRRDHAAAILVKSMEVGDIRRAVSAVGLLPQKSTYFYPKVATGLVFNSLDSL